MLGEPLPLSCDGEPVHFLADLRCPACGTLNASWLLLGASVVRCCECDQTWSVLGPDDREGA